MVNRFDVQAEQPTGQDYYDLPYNELAAGLLSKQKRYDEEAAKLAEQEVGLGKILDSRWTQGISKEIQDSYLPKIQELTAGNVDLDTPEGKQRASLLKAEIAKDERIKLAALGTANQTVWEQLMAKSPTRKLDLQLDIDPATGEPVQWKSNNAWDMKAGQSFVPYTAITPFADVNKRGDEVFSKIKADVTTAYPGYSISVDDSGFLVAVNKEGKREFVNDKLPQTQAAMSEFLRELKEGQTPEGEYFRGAYSDKGPNYPVQYAKEIAGKYFYNKNLTDYTTQFLTPRDSGDGDGSKIKINNDVFSVSGVGQSVDVKTKEYPLKTITENNKNLNTSITETAKTLGTSVTTDNEGNKKLAYPANASVALINKIDEANDNFVNTQKSNSALEALHYQLANKNGIDPAIPIEEQLPKNIYEKGKKSAEAKVESLKDYDPNTGGYTSGQYSQKDLNKVYQEEFTSSIKKSGNNKFATYFKDLEKSSAGLTFNNIAAHPLSDNKYKGTVTATKILLSDATNFGTKTRGGQVEYMQSNDAISPDHKKLFKDFASTATDADFSEKTFLFQDPESGNYAVGVRIPDGDKTVDIKVPTSLLPGIPTLAAEIDPIIHNSKLQVYRKGFTESKSQTRGLHGNLEVPGTNVRVRTTTQPTDEKVGNTIVPEGSELFTLPGINNVVFKLGSTTTSYDFLLKYGIGELTGQTNGQTITNLAREAGIDVISEPALYNRLKKYEFK